MFRNTDMVISPAASIPPEAVKVVTDISGFLNMKPRFMDPAEYDGLAALHESLPTLLGVVMFQTVVQSPGKLDVLRAANGTFANAIQALRHVDAKDLLARWRPNNDALVQQIEQMVKSLESFRQLIEDDLKDPMVLEAYLEQILHAFVDWEIRREQNNWHMEKSSPLDNVQTGVPVIGQMFSRRGNSVNDED
jgi:prephenate dehydrogenase